MADLEVPRTLATAVMVTDLAKEWVTVSLTGKGIFLTAPDRDFTRPALAWPWRVSEAPMPFTTAYRVQWGRIRDLTGHSSSASLFAAYNRRIEEYPTLLRNSLLFHLEPRAVTASFSNSTSILTIKGVGGQMVILDCGSLQGQIRDFKGDQYLFSKEEYPELLPAITGICAGGLVDAQGVEEDEDGF